MGACLTHFRIFLIFLYFFQLDKTPNSDVMCTHPKLIIFQHLNKNIIFLNTGYDDRLDLFPSTKVNNMLLN